MTIEHALPAEQAADLVRQLYRAFLEREPGENELAAHGERMQLAGMTIAVSGIVYSEEALAIRARKDRSPRPDPPEGVLAIGKAGCAFGV
jgi:hypothetical protein